MSDVTGAKGDTNAGFSGTSAEDTIEAQVAAQTGQQKVRIRVDESNLQTSYISGFRPIMGPEELTIDFGLNQTVKGEGGGESPEIVFQTSNRLIMNYYSAKRLAIAMSRIVRRYEEEFGEIELDAANRRISDSE